MQKVKTDKMLSKLGHLNDEQFKVLFFIYNTINLNSDNTNRTKIYRAVLADLTGKSERTISRITDKLSEQGLIVKDCVSDGSKLYNYYSLPVTENKKKIDNEKPKTEEILVTDDRVKGPERTLMNINGPKRTLMDQKEMINNGPMIGPKYINENQLEKEFEMKVEDEEMETESDEVVISESKLDGIPYEIVKEYLQLMSHPEEEEIYQYERRVKRMRTLLAEYPQMKEKFVNTSSMR